MDSLIELKIEEKHFRFINSDAYSKYHHLDDISSLLWSLYKSILEFLNLQLYESLCNENFMHFTHMYLLNKL